ncbi:pyridoxal phosphate-dependent decarboxylase family protein [Gimibacter soli]|uniref:Aminotransferase class V-fold PLP-dependent enzyme n=1 Tax=Gimibacter soli TaxID=3024400 RepID=A0AAE9XWI9_9PROT|nr:aminotransferase class V-fold PLP-dependent enzyme [Gimibacter soli]WCL55803.1 aminotransferase class V-fold PLP-dependent enzyme [Gimibacter soli]
MDAEEFKRQGHALVDWIADYFEGVRDYPVRAQVAPGEIAAKLGKQVPAEGEAFSAIFEDFKDIIVPGSTHWQHPRFLAYFPSNVTPPSILADMLTAAMSVNAMIWETSPAATELEERMMDWLKQAMDLPASWQGVIQDTASSAVFCAVLAARERATGWKVNAEGLYEGPKLGIYTSAETHSSLEKAVKMAGLGKASLRIVPTDDNFAMHPAALSRMIDEDKAAGIQPAMVVASVGTTGVGACDPLKAIGIIARAHGCYYHVDAAWAGTAMIAPEFRYLMDGLEAADSYAFNPHKWMGVGFDCSAHFVRDKETLIRTLTILPEYLKSTEGVTDYRDWGIQLGRRNRALKLWFVLRSYGTEAIAQMVRNHVAWAAELAGLIRADKDFELVTGPSLALLTFRLAGKDADARTEALLDAVNNDGFTYLTRTKVKGRPVIRISVGAVRTTRDDVLAAWARVKELAAGLG